MEIITLSNGKKVANFSSPHEFKFTDGTILPANSYITAEALKVDFHESVDSDGDVILDFSLSSKVMIECDYWMDLWKHKEVDVVFCPLPMIVALKKTMDVKYSPFRSIRVEDRINKLVSIEKQCI
jgi:hypothetical protein